MERQCGECSVCCFLGAVPELDKPAHVLCKYVKTDKCGSCSIFKSKELPKTCHNFKCSWRHGFGSDDDRPDMNGVMFSTNKVEDQFYMIAIETKENAISTTAKAMAIEMATKQKLPIIVVKHSSKPPHDAGDYVIVHDSILHRCKNIIGNVESMLGAEVNMYQLIKTPKVETWQQ